MPDVLLRPVLETIGAVRHRLTELKHPVRAWAKISNPTAEQSEKVFKYRTQILETVKECAKMLQELEKLIEKNYLFEENGAKGDMEQSKR